MHVSITDAAYAAVPNDPSAAVFNSAAIQSAIDAVLASGGGTVEVPDRADYYVSPVSGSTCLQGRSGVRLLGEGRHMARLMLAPGTQAHLINADTVSDFTLQALSLDGNREAFALGGAGVHVVRGRATTRLRVLDCFIRGAAYYGIGLQIDPVAPVADIGYIIDGNEIAECGGWASAGTAHGDGVDVKMGKDGLIQNNNVHDNAQRGIDVRGVNNKIIGNTVRANGVTGIAVRGFSVTSAGVAVSNPPHMIVADNYVGSSGEYGIAIFQDAGATGEGRFVVTGNVVLSSVSDGIFVTGPTTMRGIIEGNLCRSNGGLPVNVPAAYTNVTVGTNRA